MCSLVHAHSCVAGTVGSVEIGPIYPYPKVSSAMTLLPPPTPTSGDFVTGMPNMGQGGEDVGGVKHDPDVRMCTHVPTVNPTRQLYTALCGLRLICCQHTHIHLQYSFVCVCA